MYVVQDVQVRAVTVVQIITAAAIVAVRSVRRRDCWLVVKQGRLLQPGRCIVMTANSCHRLF